MSEEKKVHAYQTMIQRLGEFTQWNNLRHHLDQAVEKAVTLEELTREEAEKISNYLQRDIEDAARFLVETRQDLTAWLRFDMNLLEEKMLKAFQRMVDHTQLELNKLAAQAEIATHWTTGEIVGIGSLVCEKCGYLLQFQKPAKIPVCPQCQHDKFSRVWEEQ